MDIASQMILFADVVEHGSLSATARHLGQTPSAVSKQISALEDRLGVRLLNRSTRQLSVTPEGHSFYQRCASISSQVRDARELVEAVHAGRAGPDHPMHPSLAESGYLKSLFFRLD